MRVVVMGVTGCGKSSVGVALADEFGSTFADADAFHPDANVAKMAAGLPLTDADRWPWLAAVGEWIGSHEDSVMSCSALRHAYREVLRSHAPDVVFVHLSAPQPVLEQRVRARSATTDHFAGANLLDSQYATLEPLTTDERGVTVDVSTGGVQGALLAAKDGLSRVS